MSITKSGQVETAIEYLMSAKETRHMGIAIRDAILKLEAAQPGTKSEDQSEPCELGGVHEFSEPIQICSKCGVRRLLISEPATDAPARK